MVWGVAGSNSIGAARLLRLGWSEDLLPGKSPQHAAPTELKAEFMDAFSYHIYWSPPLTESTESGAAPVIVQQVERFKDLMRQHGQVKPIYMTEGGIRCPPFASWLPPDGFERGAPFGSEAGAGEPLTGVDAAGGLARGMVEMLSAGVEKIFSSSSSLSRTGGDDDSVAAPPRCDLRVSAVLRGVRFGCGAAGPGLGGSTVFRPQKNAKSAKKNCCHTRAEETSLKPFPAKSSA